MKKVIRNRLLCALCAVLLFGCAKDKDVNDPVVTWTQPAVASSYDVGDSVEVDAWVEDDVQLTSVRVSIVNPSLVAVLPVAVTPVEEYKRRGIRMSIPLDDVHLLSGKHFVLIYASDGVNETRSFREIYIHAFPPEREAIYALTDRNGKPVVVRYDSIATEVITGTGDYSTAAINSWDHQLYLCGRATGDLEAYRLSDHQLAWLKSGQTNLPWNTFEGVYVNDRTCYALYRDGRIIGFDLFGNAVFNATVTEGYRPVFLFQHADKLVCVEKENVGGKEKFVLINTVGGVGLQEALLDFAVVRVFTRDSDHLMVFGNRSGQGVIMEYTLSQNGFWEPHTLPAGVLSDAVQVDANTYLVSMADGIRKFTYNPLGLVDYIPGVSVQCMAYDSASDEVITGSGQVLGRYAYAGAVPVNQVILSDSIVKLMVLWNK
ncbi:MAG: hypothetical protein H6585_00360 [Flavobacteriales bacterium]|nr:hypothetical protein [Flavobacteriales bacterium]MCB9446777.1 hypothetical protein [Flavobacteriales bacterium]